MRALLLPLLPPLTALALLAIPGEALAADCTAAAWDPARPLQNPLEKCLTSATDGDTIWLEDGTHHSPALRVPGGVTIKAQVGATPVVRGKANASALLSAIGNLGSTYLLDTFTTFEITDAESPVVFEGITFEPVSGQLLSFPALTLGRALTIHNSEVLLDDCKLVPYDLTSDDGIDERSSIRLFENSPSSSISDRTGGVLAIVTGTASLEVRDSEISGIIGRWVRGTAIYADGSGVEVLITGSTTFSDSFSADGVVAVANGASLEITGEDASHPTFSNLYGLRGGAFHADGANVSIGHGVFEHNGHDTTGAIRTNAGGHGFVTNGSLVVTGGIFNDGMAATGGALTVINGTLDISGGAFGGDDKPHQARRGGLFAVGWVDDQPGTTPSLELHGGIFGPSRAEAFRVELEGLEPEEAVPAGGAVFLVGAVANLKNVELNGMVAEDGAGGAIAAFSSDLIWNGGGSEGSLAEAGGALYAAESDVTLTDVVLSGNGQRETTSVGGSAAIVNGTFSMTEGAIENSRAEFGGGIALLGEGLADLQSMDITGNQALEGGGIYGVRDAIDLDEVSLTVNTADAYGGGMMILGQLPSEDLYPYGTLTVSSSQINSNEALHGGGLKIVQVDSQIRGGEISHNTASGYAGGVLHEKSELELTGTSMVGNSAEDGVGGAVWSDWGRADLLGLYVVDNHASMSGGAFALTNSYGHVIERNLICGNSASAGAVVQAGAPVGETVPVDQATVFRHNLVDQEGKTGQALLAVADGRYAVGYNHFVRGEDLAVVFGDASETAFAHNLAAWHKGDSLLLQATSAQVFDDANVYWGVDDGLEVVGTTPAGPWLTADDVLVADPRLRGFLDGARPVDRCKPFDHHPRPDSPLVVDYAGLQTDPQGDHGGLFAGYVAANTPLDWSTDLDGDDSARIFDCDDSDEGIGDRLIQYQDLDGDGLGGLEAEGYSCEPLLGHVQIGGDCDDNDASVTDDCESDTYTFYGSRCSTTGGGATGALFLAGLLVVFRRRRHSADPGS